MIHFTSDTHWGHKNIIKYSNRPYDSVDQMNEALVDNWNKVVKANDEVYHLGDFSFQTYPEFLATVKRLNGRKHFICGNHDKMLIQHKNEILRDGIFQSFNDYKEIKPEGQHIVMFHFGCRVWNKSHRGSIHLYGHSHGSLPPHGKSVDVGVDAKFINEEYRPVSLDEVVEYMKTRQFEAVDHHMD